MHRITFERVSDRASYTHFIEVNGDTIALTALEKRDTRVGLVFGQEFPTDAQRQAIAHLANVATGADPTVEILFAEGCSPFPGLLATVHPLYT